MNEQLLNDSQNNQNKKKLQDNFTNTIYKRPFLIEKIQRDIYRGKEYFNFIKSKNSDSKLLKFKKNIKKKVKAKNINPLFQNLSSSNNFANFYEFIGKLNNNLRIKSIKKIMNINPSEKILQRQKSDFSLPVISNRKTVKIPKIKKNPKTLLSMENNNIIEENKEKNNYNINNKDIIAKSEINNTNDIYITKPRMIKIRSFSNICKNNDVSNEQKLYDINEINEKYNLHLNLDKKEKKTNTIFRGKKYTMVGMLNKLFQYYSSESNINNNTNTTNMDNKTTNIFNNSKNNTFNKYIPFKNMNEINNEDTNTFLTKLNLINNAQQINEKEKEKEFSVTKFINNRCSLSDINRKNKEIIDKNKKIKIDCLISKIESDISIQKILYQYIGKTIYEITKDESYARLKEFEKKILEVLKKENNNK